MVRLDVVMAPRWILVAVLCALAGCGAFAGAGTAPDDSPTRTLTPVSVPEETVSGPVPPGLSRTGLANESRLVAAHVRSLEGERYYLRIAGNLTASNGTTLSVYEGNFIAGLDCGRYSYAVEEGTVASEIARLRYGNGTHAFAGTLFFDGSVIAWVQRNFDGSLADPCGVRPLDPTLEGFATELLDGAGTTVRNRPGGDGVVVSVSGGSVSRLPGPSADVGNVSVRSAELLVSPAGRIAAVEVRYAGRRNGTRVVGRLSLRYDRVGTATLAEPQWVERAR